MRFTFEVLGVLDGKSRVELIGYKSKGNPKKTFEGRLLSGMGINE